MISTERKGENMKKILILMLLMSFLTGCGAAIRCNIKAQGIQLRQYNKMYLVLQTVSGAISVQSTNLGAGFGVATTINPSTDVLSTVGSSIGTSHAMSGRDQAILVAQSLAFELNSLGFQMVDSAADADIVALFSIGSVRNDPIVGWIADQAFITFKNAKTNETICTFRADCRFITPTTRTIVKNLVNEIEKYY